MNILNLDQIRKSLESRNLRHVERNTDVHYDTLRNIAKGRVKDIHLSTAVKLSEYFDKY